MEEKDKSIAHAIKGMITDKQGAENAVLRCCTSQEKWKIEHFKQALRSSFPTRVQRAVLLLNTS